MPYQHKQDKEPGRQTHPGQTNASARKRQNQVTHQPPSQAAIAEATAYREGKLKVRDSSPDYERRRGGW